MMSTAPAPTLDVLLAGGTLTINNAQSVKVQAFVGTHQVVVTSPQVVTGDTSGTYNNVTTIVINGTDGNDSIDLNDTDIKAYVNTFRGVDQIMLSGSGTTVVATDNSATIILDTGPKIDLVSITGTSVYDVSKGHDYIEVDGVPVA